MSISGSSEQADIFRRNILEHATSNHEDVKQAKDFLKNLPNICKTSRGSLDEWAEFQQKFEGLCTILSPLAEEQDNIKKISKQVLRVVASKNVELVRAPEGINRQRIKKIRDIARQQLEEGVPAREISRQLSESLTNFVQDLYSESIAKQSPPPCRYSLLLLGSLARLEAAPYPDMDNILILEEKTPETIEYFWKVHQDVGDTIYRLGESGDLGMPGFRTCEEGNLNPLFMRYQHRHSEFGQRMREGLIAEENLTELLSDEKHGGRPTLYGEPIEGDSTITDGAINDSRHILGDEEVFVKHRELVTSHQTFSPDKVKKGIKESIEGYRTGPLPSPYTSSELPKTLHVKEQLLRFPQGLLSNLAKLHGINTPSTFDRIETLRKKGVFDDSFAAELVAAMDNLIKIRIDVQCRYGFECEYVSTVDLEQLPAIKAAAEKELADRLAINPDIESKFKECDGRLKELRAQVNDSSDTALKEALEYQEQLWKQLDSIFSHIWTLKNIILKKHFPNIERKKIVLSAEDVEILNKSCATIRQLAAFAEEL